ncbi:MAG: hypothetical protein ACREQ9_17780, partial [Candidatus Binatia bacterium]
MRSLLTRSLLVLTLLVGRVPDAPAEERFLPERVGTVRTLPAEPGPHWFWLSDIVLHRAALFDGDTGTLLGTISSGSAG